MASLYRSRVNQPDRVFLNSSDDTVTPPTGTFSSFQINFQTPILDADRVQLLRATIPNPLNPLPDYQLLFWYYRLASANSQLTLPTLACLRIMPTNTVSVPAGCTVPNNTYLESLADFVTLLNTAANATDTTLNNYWYEPNDLVFTLGANNQISVKGTDGTKFYCPAAWNDPNIATALATNPIYINYNTGTLQPYVLDFTLALRVGYSIPFQRNPTRPATLTGLASQGTVNVIPDSYPNLLYTSCVYLYTNIIPGSSLGSGGQHNLLAVVPNNTNQGGVIQYTTLLINWLKKVAAEIYTIQIEMRDDANQPIPLSDNAVVNIELAFDYDTNYRM